MSVDGPLQPMVSVLEGVLSRNQRFKTEHGYQSTREEYEDGTLEQLKALGYLN